MVEFLISFFLLLTIITTKTYFLLNEKEFWSSLIARSEYLVFITLFILGAFSFFRNYKSRRKNKFKLNLGFVSTLLLLINVFTLTASFSLNTYKKTIDWDAVALYDARAIYFLDGVSYSEMNTLSMYDLKNKYYYSLYPPYTSILHTFWKTIDYIPVSVVYSIFLACLSLFLIFFSKKYLGTNLSLASSFLVISGKPIFETSLIEYTNLPYTLFFTVGTLLVFSYFDSKELWRFWYGILAISSTQWIRYSEPVWLVVVLSFAFYLFIRNKLRTNKINLTIFLFVCTLQYFSWNYFIKNISHTPQIFEGNLGVKILEGFLGFFTGSELIVFTHFVNSLGVLGIIFISTIIVGKVSFEKFEVDKHFKFLSIVVFSVVTLYYLILYYLVFQADWWREIGGSIGRTLTFLLPISTFVIFREVRNLYGTKLKFKNK